jgi:hypothetical protein
VNWRESEPYLATEYLDVDTAELMDIVSGELPYQRVRDGNVTAWLLRAEQAGVIATSDRIQLVASARAARQKRDLERGVAV